MIRRRMGQARTGFWLMLALVIMASSGMKWLAWRAIRSTETSDLQAAIYRYPANAAPPCEAFNAGAELRAEWIRMEEPRVPGSTSAGCSAHRGVAM